MKFWHHTSRFINCIIYSLHVDYIATVERATSIVAILTVLVVNVYQITTVLNLLTAVQVTVAVVCTDTAGSARSIV